MRWAVPQVTTAASLAPPRTAAAAAAYAPRTIRARSHLQQSAAGPLKFALPLSLECRDTAHTANERRKHDDEDAGRSRCGSGRAAIAPIKAGRLDSLIAGHGQRWHAHLVQLRFPRLRVATRR